MKPYLILIIILFCSCSKKTEINKVELAAGLCFGDCQPIAISFDRSLTYNFYGGESPFKISEKDNRLHGYYTGRMNQALWDSLTNELENINYKELDTTYQNSVDDQSLEIFVYYGGKVKHIQAQSASLPQKVSKVFYSILESYKSIHLNKSDKTIRFESTILSPIPMPDTKNIDFSPPDLKQ